MKLINANKFKRFFLTCSKKQLVVIPTIAIILFSIASAFILSFFHFEGDSTYERFQKEGFNYFVVAVLVSPFLETLIFQSIPFFVLTKFIKQNYITLIIMGVIFGAVHYFNQESIVEMFITTIIGVLFAFIYYVASERKDTYPFVIIWLIHTFYNLFVFFVKTVFL